jgi:hypothetical protein
MKKPLLIQETIPLTLPSGQRAWSLGDAVPLQLGALHDRAGLEAVLRGGQLLLRATGHEARVISDELTELELEDGALLTARREAEELLLSCFVVAPPPQGAPFAVPPDALPALIHDHAAELSAWGQPEAAAGLCLRWAWSTSAGAEHPLYSAAVQWWREQDNDVQLEVEGLVVAGAVQLAAELEALGAARLPGSALETLALRRDTLASACALLFATGRGQGALRAERGADELLASLLAAQHNGAPYASPLLDALARRDLGWWTVAPGAAPPPLDPDTVQVLDQQELDLLDDLDAMAAEGDDLSADNDPGTPTGAR